MEKNPKYFYTYVKNLTRTKTKIGPFTDKDGEIINEEPSSVLQKQYESVWTNPKENFKICDRKSFFDIVGEIDSPSI